MVSKLNTRRTDKRQPASRRLSGAVFKNPVRRVRRIYLSLGSSRQLVISLRRFRTRRERRSKLYKQLVIQPRLIPIREIAVRTDRRKIRQKRNKQARQATFLWLPRRLVAPLLLILLSFAGATYFGTHLNHAVSLDLKPQTAVIKSSPKPLAKTMPRSQPVHLKIPSIGVDTDLTTMGLAPDGSLQMPVRYDIAAWYFGSPTPGQLGPAIIAGHVDNYKGIGVFFYLKELQVGASIEVDRADGSTATFKVTQMSEYPRDSFPTQAVYGNINYAGIRLITCGGTFSYQNYEYSDNIVAYGILQ